MEGGELLRMNRTKEKKFAFDYCFDKSVSSQEIFEKTTKELTPTIIEGYNATVFAYGATGAGKTHTYNLSVTVLE